MNAYVETLTKIFGGPVAVAKSRIGRAALLLTVAFALGSAAYGSGSTELEIGFRDAPVTGVATKPVSGWPLTLSIEVAKNRLRAGTNKAGGIAVVPPVPPRLSLVGPDTVRNPLMLVFTDPDGCPSWMPEDAQRRHLGNVRRGVAPEHYFERCTSPPPAPWPLDEGIELTPGQSVPFGIGEQLEVRVFDPATRTNGDLAPIGAYAGSNTDPYGYGRSPRLPSLVLLADSGPGVVFDEDFDRPPRLTARNLAGFVGSVSYELKNHRSRVEVEAHMSVPPGLFTPVVLIDLDLGKSCDGKTFQARVDGGAPTCGLPVGAGVEAWIANDGFFASRLFLSQHVVTVRAFVVRGDAPELLDDLNGDGVVDIADARKRGLELLSDQAVMRVRHYPIEPFLREWSPLLADLDGNGATGDLSEPPVTGSPATLVDPPP